MKNEGERRRRGEQRLPPRQTMPYPSADRAQPNRPPWRKSDLMVVAPRCRVVHHVNYFLAVFLALFFFLAVFFVAFRFFAMKVTSFLWKILHARDTPCQRKFLPNGVEGRLHAPVYAVGAGAFEGGEKGRAARRSRSPSVCVKRAADRPAAVRRDARRRSLPSSAGHVVALMIVFVKFIDACADRRRGAEGPLEKPRKTRVKPRISRRERGRGRAWPSVDRWPRFHRMGDEQRCRTRVNVTNHDR